MDNAIEEKLDELFRISRHIRHTHNLLVYTSVKKYLRGRGCMDAWKERFILIPRYSMVRMIVACLQGNLTYPEIISTFTKEMHDLF